MMLARRHRDVSAFVRSLHFNYSVRFHAGILLAAATLAGLLASKAMLWMGVESPVLRYPIAVAAGYGFFLVFIDWWLHYIGIKRTALDDIPDPSFMPSHHAPGGVDSLPTPPRFDAGGGTFDGGGASVGWDDAAGSAVQTKAEIALRAKASAVHIALETKANAAAGIGEAAASSGMEGAASGASALGELAFPVLVIAVVAGLFIAAGGWVVVSTPAMLVETAVDVAVISGLIRSVAPTRDATWFDALLARTFFKVAALVGASFVIGLALRFVDPTANTVGQLVSHWMQR